MRQTLQATGGKEGILGGGKVDMGDRKEETVGSNRLFRAAKYAKIRGPHRKEDIFEALIEGGDHKKNGKGPDFWRKNVRTGYHSEPPRCSTHQPPNSGLYVDCRNQTGFKNENQLETGKENVL